MAGHINIALALHRHPESPAPALSSVVARVLRTPEGQLSVTYTLEGELERISLPEARAQRIGERLWEHTCFEIFIARAGVPGYLEFNFAPSGEWAAYAFSGYRLPAPTVAASFEPKVETRRPAGRFELEATLELARLSPGHPGAKLSFAISAVIEAKDGSLSYWALRHAPGKPDFHHGDAFMLNLG